MHKRSTVGKDFVDWKQNVKCCRWSHHPTSWRNPFLALNYAVSKGQLEPKKSRRVSSRLECFCRSGLNSQNNEAKAIRHCNKVSLIALKKHLCSSEMLLCGADPASSAFQTSQSNLQCSKKVLHFTLYGNLQPVDLLDLLTKYSFSKLSKNFHFRCSFHTSQAQDTVIVFPDLAR